MKTKCRLCSAWELNSYVGSEVNNGKYIVIAQNPGKTEVQENKPLIGKAGQLWMNSINLVGLKRTDFNIYNTYKCYTMELVPNVYDKQAHKCIRYITEELRNDMNTIIWVMGKSAMELVNIHGNITDNASKMFTCVFLERMWYVYISEHPAHYLYNNDESGFTKRASEFRSYVRRLAER